MKKSHIMYLARICFLTIIYTLFFSPVLLAEHTIKQISPTLTLEVINKEMPSFVPGESVNKIKVANLWMAGAVTSPQTSTRMIISCQSPQEMILIFCFDFYGLANFSSELPVFENDKIGIVKYQIDNNSVIEEKWSYIGGVKDSNEITDSKTYYGVIQPVQLTDHVSISNLASKSNEFLKKIQQAKQLKIEICLENGLCSTSEFDLHYLDKGLKALNDTCMCFKNSY